MKLRTALCTCASMLPAGHLKNSILRIFGWSIGRNVSIGPCLITDVLAVHIGNNVTIGPFNVIRGLRQLKLEESAIIGQWNWITASSHMRHAGCPARLEMKPHSAITSRHYIDCTGSVSIGAYTTVAGERSTFLTHGISWNTSEQTYGPIQIGDYCLLSSNLQLTPRTTVGDKIVVGMGSTIAGELIEPGLYVQPRASLVKRDLTGEYFERVVGHVDGVAPPAQSR